MAHKTYREKLSQLILNAETEIDELRIKVALGKLHGADIFQEMKKDLGEVIDTIEGELSGESREISDSIISRAANLKDQLSAGKAVTLKDYEEQKEKISNSIRQLDQTVRDARLKISQSVRLNIQNELEKFLLKLEVLQIRYELGRLDLKDKVEDKKRKFRKQFEELLATLEDETHGRMEEHGNELKDAYDQLREMIK
jgi:hypothetical protein